MSDDADLKRKIDALSGKLDRLLFNQAALLVQLKQTAEESMHIPADQPRALAVLVDVQSQLLEAAFQEARNISSEAKAAELAQRRRRGSTSGPALL